MLSVVFIVSGIVWVIFTQADSRFEDGAQFDNLKAEQDEILRQYYQLQQHYLKREDTAVKQPLAAVKQATAQPLPQVNTAAVAANHSVWDETAANPSQMPDFLRNNPWSPDYQPN